MKIRSTWPEPVFINLNHDEDPTLLVKVDPDEVIDVPDTAADLLDQREGTMFTLADKVTTKKAEA